MTKNDLEKLNPSVDDFAALLEESLSKINLEEGKVVTGKVSAIENDFVIVDVGLKTEGRIPVREFKSSAGTNLPSTGDSVDVYLDRVENSNGEAVLSREKAKRQESWNNRDRGNCGTMHPAFRRICTGTLRISTNSILSRCKE